MQYTMWYAIYDIGYTVYDIQYTIYDIRYVLNIDFELSMIWLLL